MGQPIPTLPVSECEVCQKNTFPEKAGPGCMGCPAFKDTHYTPYGTGDDSGDVIILATAPQAPRKFFGKTSLPRYNVPNHHQPFKEDGAKVVIEAFEQIVREGGFHNISYKALYLVRCAMEKVPKRVAIACKSNIDGDLQFIHRRRVALGYPEGLTILACGVDVVHALGIHVRKEKEALGRVFEVTYEGIPLRVIPTRSLSAYASAIGKYNTLLADVERAVKIAKGVAPATISREDLMRGYIFPRDEKEVTEVIDLVLNYSAGGISPRDWSVASDTETNTLHPHWVGYKLLSVGFSWDTGKATAIAVDHPDTPYDPVYVKRELKRAFEADKKWIWHNGKYDQKALWHGLKLPRRMIGRPGWDTMLAEHIIEEAKPEEYGLKPLVKRFFPALSGYEDQLQATLESQDGALNGVTEGAVEIKGTEVLNLPPAVLEALQRAIAAKLIGSAKFRPSTIEKLLASQTLQDLHRQDLQILLKAHAGGEFNQKAKKAAQKAEQLKAEQMGGYQGAALPDLLFYNAVDCDVTRRLALVQAERMEKEDTALELARRRTEDDITLEERMGGTPKYRVLRLCPDQSPQIKILREFKLPRQVELAKIEDQGVNIDLDYLKWGAEKLEMVVGASGAQIFEMCGETFDLTPRQIANHLFFGGVGYIHPNPEHAEEIAKANPDTVLYQNGRITYRPLAFTATHQIQTGAPVLQALVSRYKCPLSNLILSRKKAEKARVSVFGNAYQLATMFGDNHLHGGYNLTGTATDRLSSSSGVRKIGFNWQNVPKGLLGALRDTRGRLALDDQGVPIFDGVNCKKLIIPDDPSMCFGNADAKGAEVTIFGTYAAAFDGGEALVNALIGGMDPHCFFGSEALNPQLVAAGLQGEDRRLALERAGIDDDHAWSYEDFFTRETYKKKGVGNGNFDDPKTWETPSLVRYALQLDALRDNIKRVVFGMLFGAGITKISEIAGISLELAQKIRDLLFSKFPSIPTYMEHTKWEVQQFGLVETFHGGRRRCPMDVSKIPKGLLARFQRQGINFKIQRTNSDIVLMVLCWIAEILERDMGGRVLLTVHDSIGFQVPKKYAHQIPDLFLEQGTKRVAKECPWLKSPYRWDVALGPSYGEYQKAKDYIAALPPPVPEAALDGYNEEDIEYNLINHEEFDLTRETSQDLTVG